MPREIVTSKNDKKTHFVSTARTSVTRHVILNVPKFPNPKGTAFSDPIKRKIFRSKWTKEGVSFANVVSGEIPIKIASRPKTLTANKKEDSSSGFLTQDNHSSDFSQVLELFNTISKPLVKGLSIQEICDFNLTAHFCRHSIGFDRSMAQHLAAGGFMPPPPWEVFILKPKFQNRESGESPDKDEEILTHSRFISKSSVDIKS
ncbi:hypothetical protein TNCV_1301871 [Trichonephila clavipes]|nr:hypothetical protein TNCV_1301871 [Trichonephila clavipes]